LKVNGIEGFLDNFLRRSVSDDPIRNAISVLGVHVPDQWLTVEDLAARAGMLGLLDPLVPKNARANHEATKRELGKVLTSHVDEHFVGETETQRLKFRLEKARRRFESANPHTRYRFELVESEPRDVDYEPADVEAKPSVAQVDA
jgi:hypothetical protein